MPEREQENPLFSEKFTRDLAMLINRYSVENDSDTPDWLLAEYLVSHLKLLGITMRARDKWHGFKPWSHDVKL